MSIGRLQGVVDATSCVDVGRQQGVVDATSRVDMRMRQQGVVDATSRHCSIVIKIKYTIHT